MKKIFNILSGFILAALLFSACDPTKKDFTDVYDSYNTSAKVKFSDTTTVYTLTSADYQKSSVSDIKKNYNFSDAYTDSSYLLEIFSKTYNAKIDAQIKVSFSYYLPLNLKKDTTRYTVADSVAEYGNKYLDWSTLTDVYSYLVKNYPQAARGQVVILTYNWYVTAITVVFNTFVCLGNNTWLIVTPLVQADYTAMGQKYANFSNTTDPKNLLPIYLKNTYLPYAKMGDNILIQYAVYTAATSTKPANTAQYVYLYTFNSTAWSIPSSVITKTDVVKFDGFIWKFLPPVKVIMYTDPLPAASSIIPYTLTSADYTMVFNKFADFDRRAGQSEGDVNVLLAKIATILKARFSGIAVGQIYAVTFADYSGSNPPPNATIYVKVVPQ